MINLSMKEQDLLARVISKPELEPFFFKKLKDIKWLEPLDNNDFFNPEKIPKPTESRHKGYVNINYWPASIYFANISNQLNNPDNIDKAIKVRNIIRHVTNYAKSNNISNYKVWYQFSQAMSSIPHEILEAEDLSSFEYWLNDSFGRGVVAQELGSNLLVSLLEDNSNNELAVGIIKLLFEVAYIDKDIGSMSFKDYIFKVIDWEIKNVADRIGALSVSSLGIEAVKLFESLLVGHLDITKGDKWFNIRRRAIEDHEQDGPREDVDDILVSLYRDSLLAYSELDTSKARDYIARILSGEYLTTKRVAIYVCGVKYELFRDIAKFIVTNEFLNDNFRHEMWCFINSNYSKLDDNAQQTYLEIINKISILDDDGNVQEGATAYKKAIWLSAIKNISEGLTERYLQEIKIAGTEPEHPEFFSYMSSGWVEHKSPISTEELREMDISQMISLMDSIDKGNRLSENNKVGIIRAFKEIVKSDPEEILRNLDQFVTSDVAYSHQIINGITELWNEKASLPWDDIWINILKFCQNLIRRDEFWLDKNTQQSHTFIPTRHWVVGEIGRLIESGVRSDDHAFNLDLMSFSYDILTELLIKQKGNEFDVTHDSVTTAINSPRGKVIEALINHALRHMRNCAQTGKSEEEIWGIYVDRFNLELEKRNTGELEFVTLMAVYLPNFLYMSQEWTLSNLHNLFDKDNYEAWVCAFNGYTYVTAINNSIFIFLRDNNHFHTALDDKIFRERVSERIIQNAVVAYIQNIEKLEEQTGLLNHIIRRNIRLELHQIIWFTWTLRDKSVKDLVNKIFMMWQVMLEQIDYTTEDGRMTASDLCQWTSFVDDLSGVQYEWVLQIAKYAEYNHNSRVLLKMISRLSKNYPYQTHKIWLNLLTSYSYDYPEESIRQALENYLSLNTDTKHEGTRISKSIVDAYLRHGLDRPSKWLSELLSTQ